MHFYVILSESEESETLRFTQGDIYGNFLSKMYLLSIANKIVKSAV